MKHVHIAFKCAYNDNRGDGLPVVGYMGACSKSTTSYNVRKGAPWCSLPECPCSGYVLSGEPRSEQPCYESRMLLDWKAYAGYDHNGPSSWTPRRIIGAAEGGIAFLTTRYPGVGEAERFIFAAFAVAEIIPYDPQKSGWVAADSRLKLALSQEELVYFWDHYRNKGRPDYIGWGSGRYRYLDNKQAEGAMGAIAAVVRDEGRKAIAKEMANIAQRAE